jgi:hypothetical protein
VRGVVVSLHDLDRRRSYRDDVTEIARLGANTVSILPTWDQADVRSPEVGDGAATDRQIADAVAAAHRAGLQVVLAPTLRIAHLGEGEWRGVLQPPDWGVWFASYRRRLLSLARLGERQRVEALSVGSELCSSERFDGEWRRIIAEVRAVFGGDLTYQANWDHRHVPAFLSDLDLLGTNAYFELLGEEEAATVDRLVDAWQPYRAELVAWAAALDRPLLITEVGYPSQRGAVAHPWDYTRDAPVDLEEQRVAYAALFRAWHGAPRTMGLLLYEWWGAGGGGDRGYTPRGKPAEGEARRWFAGG